MGNHGGRSDRTAAEELILRTIAAHADSLLRTARRHSICVDDAQDAYQRGLEIFMRHADRLDPGGAGAWLHTVVKREAKALRRSRQKLLGSEEIDLDSQEARRLPTPEEQLLSFDMISRSAEALQRLKPQELRALWLKAQGHSYNDIGAITGWSYTKVNRCLAEGRQSFLERYAGIESGDECNRWMPILSAIVDGEATQAQILELRPHLRNCPGCRGRLKAMRDSSEPLTAVLPLPLAAVAVSSGEPVSNLVLRMYEAIAGGLHERAAYSVTKAQALLEASAAGKVAAVAASAAAVAGGGYVSVEKSIDRPSWTETPRPKVHRKARDRTPTVVELGRYVPAAPSRSRLPAHSTREQAYDEFSSSAKRLASGEAPEFAADNDQRAAPRGGAPVPDVVNSLPSAPAKPVPSPEFGSTTTKPRGGEFGP